jgi:lysophospholipase L1-like esterase
MHSLLVLVALLGLQAPETKPDKWEKDIAAFEEKDKASPPPQNEIVFVGSSSIRLWKSTEAFPDLKVINRGFGGSEMGDAAKYAERIVLPYKPRIVVVFAGGNDINAGKSPEQVADAFKSLVGKVHAALPKTKVYYISLFPNVKRRAQDEKCCKANELIQAFTKTDERLGYIDTASKMRAADGGPRPELLRDDGLHMNDDGYKIWNEMVGAILRSAPR